MEPDPSDTPNNDKPKRSRWWLWALGLLFLLVFCGDDDDDRPRRYCYNFTDGQRLCFAEPLPKDKHCYIEGENTVRCYDQPK